MCGYRYRVKKIKFKFNKKVLKFLLIIRCMICGEQKGILTSINPQGEMAHLRCLKFIPEIFENSDNIFNFSPDSDTSEKGILSRNNIDLR